MIPNYKQSCIKINLDFAKPIEKQDIIKHFTNNSQQCIFCNYLITRMAGSSYHLRCISCQYAVFFRDYNYALRIFNNRHNINISQIAYNGMSAMYIKDEIRIFPNRRVFNPFDLTKSILNLKMKSIDFQILLNKINMLKLTNS